MPLRKLAACLVLIWGVGALPAYPAPRRSAAGPTNRASSQRRLTGLARTVAALDPALAVVHARGGEGERIIGTGFCVRSDGYFLTALHVVAGGDARIAYLKAGDYWSVPAKTVAKDEALDLALLRAACTTPALRLGAEIPNPGEPIATVGFHYTFELDRAFIPSVSSGVVAAVRPRDEEPQKGLLLQLDLAVERGASGSPLVLHNAATVVGLVTSHLEPVAFSDRGARVAFAVPGEDLIKFLRKSLPAQPPTTRKPSVSKKRK